MGSLNLCMRARISSCWKFEFCVKDVKAAPADLIRKHEALKRL